MTLDPVPVHEGSDVPDAFAALDRGDLLLPYQAGANALINSSALVAIEKSRRVGLTWGVASDAVLIAASQRGQGGMDVFYTSYSHDMTREFIDACSMWSKAFGMGLAEVGEFLFEDQDEHGHSKFIKAFRIDFASGFSIVALPSSPRSLRGKQGVVIIDEAAFVNDLAEVLKAALALLIWGGRVVVISTHNGVDNPFNQLLDEIRSGRRSGKTMTITFNDALDQGFYERVCLMKGETPTPEGKKAFEAEIRGFYGDAAEEELDCIPAAGSGAFILPELVVAAQHEDAGKPELYQGGMCFGGRDIAAGRGGDFAIMWVFELVGGALWLRERVESRSIDLSEQEKIFDRLMSTYKVVRFDLDQTGMGEGEVLRAQQKYGDCVEGIILSGPARLDMATAMKKRFEDGTIYIPDDAVIRADLRAIKKTRGLGNTVRLVNEGKVHADRFWAGALACLGASIAPPAYRGYQGLPRGRGKYDDAPIEERRGFRMRASDRAPSSSSGRGTTW